MAKYGGSERMERERERKKLAKYGGSEMMEREREEEVGKVWGK